MHIKPFLKYCPQCKAAALHFHQSKQYVCHNCHWEYYHNVAASSGAVLFCGEKMLFIKRKNEPAKGKLTVPGGFVDPGESAEMACKREIREELGMESPRLSFFNTYSNRYFYKGIEYATCDVIYWGVIDAVPRTFCTLEVEAVLLCSPEQINPGELAFLSTKQLLCDIIANNPLTSKAIN